MKFPKRIAITDIDSCVLFVFGIGILSIIMIILITIININKKPSNIFLTKEEALQYLQSDSDGFYKTFKASDLSARNVKSLDEYLRVMSSAIDEFTADEVATIKRAIESGNTYLQQVNAPWFDGKKCSGMPWKLACVVGEAYEAGLPHTRGDVIFFPRRYLTHPEHDFTQTLIHERIHIYQKMYRDDADAYIKNNGYTRRGIARETNTRANPDIDGWTYADQHGDVMSADYKVNATSVRDVILPKNRYEYEHPLEKMAIEIAECYN
jgi:hypothetical protein